MSEDIITINEVMNDGRAIHLYYSEMYKEYVAYGLSAYIACQRNRNIEAMPYMSYSSDLQMPMVRIESAALETLRRELIVKKSTKEYVCLYDVRPINEAQYVKWATWLRG